MATKSKLSKIDRARAYIAKMDPAVQNNGGDKQTFIVCCKLVEFGLSQVDAATVALEYNLRCDPPWSEKMLLRKLRMAFSRATPKKDFCDEASPQAWRHLSGGKPEVKKWPDVNKALQRHIIQGGPALGDLLELSPICLEHGKSHAMHYVSQLFPGDPLICCGKTMMDFWTRKVSCFGRRVEDFQFIVPSPMSRQKGKIQDPEPDGPTESEHTLDNTGARRYAVVEFDEGSYDDHAALIWHLGTFFPLVLAVHSGGKSLHGWFWVEGDSDDDVFKFYRYAVSIGADYHTFLKSQFVRMPDGRRANGRRQEVFYFNPKEVQL